MGGVAGLLGAEGRTDRHGRVRAPARVGAQAVSVWAGARSRLHGGERAARHSENVRDGDRPIPAAQLRSPLPRPMRTREALASSYNVPAVDVASRWAPASLLQTLHLAGFESLRAGRRVLRARPGAGERRRDADRARERLSRAGERRRVAAVDWRRRDWRAGAAACGGARRVISPVASAIVLDMLSDPAARMPGFGIEHAVRLSLPRRREDGHEPSLHRQLGRRHDACIHGRGVGRKLQRTGDGGSERRTGAGPLLHRAVMAVSRRVRPGVLTTPAEAGAVSVPVCRLSGTARDIRVRAAHRVVRRRHRADARGRLGARRTSRAARRVRGVVATRAARIRPTRSRAPSLPRVAGANGGASLTPPPARPARASQFRITSPLEGDRYSIPAGVEARYASIALRQAGLVRSRSAGPSTESRTRGDRWALVPGIARDSGRVGAGDTAEVRVVVER